MLEQLKLGVSSELNCLNENKIVREKNDQDALDFEHMICRNQVMRSLSSRFVFANQDFSKSLMQSRLHFGHQ